VVISGALPLKVLCFNHEAAVHRPSKSKNPRLSYCYFNDFRGLDDQKNSAAQDKGFRLLPGAVYSSVLP